jgi:predicted AAA+ superfamily ATPase
MPAAKRKADDEVPGATTAAPAERVVTDPVEVSGTTAPPAAADEPENQVVDHVALLRQFEGIQDDGPMGDGQLEEDEALEHEQSRNQLEALNEESLRRCLELTQSRARDRLRVLHGVKHLEAQRDALTTMLNALLKGESNSALLLGPSGWGKTAVSGPGVAHLQQSR